MSLQINTKLLLQFLCCRINTYNSYFGLTAAIWLTLDISKSFTGPERSSCVALETSLLCCVHQALGIYSLSRAFGLADPGTLSCDKTICYSGLSGELWCPGAGCWAGWEGRSPHARAEPGHPKVLSPKDRPSAWLGRQSSLRAPRECHIPTRSKNKAEVPLLNTTGNLSLFLNFSCYTEQGSVQS